MKRCEGDIIVAKWSDRRYSPRDKRSERPVIQLCPHLPHPRLSHFSAKSSYRPQTFFRSKFVATSTITVLLLKNAPPGVKPKYFRYKLAITLAN